MVSIELKINSGNARFPPTEDDAIDKNSQTFEPVAKDPLLTGRDMGVHKSFDNVVRCQRKLSFIEIRVLAFENFAKHQAINALKAFLVKYPNVFLDVVRCVFL